MKTIQPDFNFFLPVEFEKAQNKKGEKVMKIKGIASTPDEDSEGEILDPIGFDLSRFLSIGFLNWNHQSKNDAGKIIGEPTLAKITPEGNLYVEGTLYNGHPLAESVWNLAEVLEKNGSKRKIGFSIEGRATQRDPVNPKRITKALLTGLAVTPTPVNCATYIDLVKGEQKQDFTIYEYDNEAMLQKAEASNNLYEFQINDKYYVITKSFQMEEVKKSEDTAQQAKIKKVMTEFKAGTLKSSSGELVTDRDQALAIAMSEAGMEKAMDVAATKPLTPESLDKKPKVLDVNIKKAILSGIIPIEKVQNLI